MLKYSYSICSLSIKGSHSNVAAFLLLVRMSYRILLEIRSFSELHTPQQLRPVLHGTAAVFLVLPHYLDSFLYRKCTKVGYLTVCRLAVRGT